MDIDALHIRKGTELDAENVCDSFQLFLGRPGDISYIRNALDKYPSALAFKGNRLIGFAYCGFMSPDLIELANIALHSEERNAGVGTKLLQFIEEESSQHYDAILLTNSDLYEGKHNASNFYEKNRYRLVAGTGNTNLFWKDLRI